MSDLQTKGSWRQRIRPDRLRAHMHRALRMTAVPELYYRALVFSRWILRGHCSKRPHRLEPELIVSLTSFPKRFPTLHLTIQSLLTQSLAADRVILWLYAPDVKRLPMRVRELIAHGLEIREINQDLRSYKKLIPSLSVFPEALIATADDDIYYPESWLEHLVDAYEPGAKHVIGCRAHRIKHRPDGRVAPYTEWGWELRGQAQGANVFLTGGAGTLYPPGALPAMALDSSIYMELCPTADDVWINFMLRLNGFSAKKTGASLTVYDWMGSREHALGKRNVINGGNDEAMAAMIVRYGDVFRGSEHS